ncbi:MOSC domain-containing protein [Geodermatophilus sp. URMC 63]
MTTDVGRVVSLARYPVKSMAGEPLAATTIGARGLDGDRVWAAYTEDGGIGSGKTTRRFRRVDGLLGLVAAGTPPAVSTPGGRSAPVGSAAADDLVSAVLGRRLRLAEEAAVPHHDEAPVHVVTTAGLRRVAELLGASVAATRFRANVVVDVPGAGFIEDAWAGRCLALGDEVLLRPDGGMTRCRMVDLLDGGRPAGDGLLRLLGRERALLFGLRAQVEHGGTVRVGDVVRVE